MVQAIRYRVGQFFRALGPRLPDGEVRVALEILETDARDLFRRQETQDQRHALAVCRALRKAGHTDPRLLRAALLHDVGKAAAPCPAWIRAVAVVMGRFAPSQLDRLTNQDLGRPRRADGWRRALTTHARHAEVGALWAQEAGCCKCTVALVRRHREQLVTTETEEDRLLAALQAVDGVN